MMNMTEKQTNSKPRKRKNILSIAKWGAVIMFVIGLIVETFWVTFIGEYNTFARLTGLSGVGLRLFGLIVLISAYAIVGFIGGAIGAFLYNLVVKRSNE